MNSLHKTHMEMNHESAALEETSRRQQLGDFGPNDQLGRVNLIGTEQVLKGVQEVQEGVTFCLSLPLDIPGGKVLNPRRSPPKLTPTALDEDQYINFPSPLITPS
ncbi:hypothetical protein HAALTHF_13220n [Vreelandella aquamarina]|nr:hypothetical protein HAALTHF_13220n [Halomonas axialensis]